MNALAQDIVNKKVARHLHELNLRYGNVQAQKDLFTLEEAAQKLSLSERTVRELIDAGILKSVLVKTNPRAKRGSRRITKNQIDSYIKKLEVEARS